MSDRVEVVVDSRLRLRLDAISEQALKELREEFQHSNPQFYKLKSLGFPTWKEPAVIKTHHDAKGILDLPRGGARRVIEVLTERHGYKIKWIDKRNAPPADYVRPHSLTPYPFQDRVVGEILSKENTLVRSGTGSGKTTIASLFAGRVGMPALVVVWNAALFDQWQLRIARELGYDKREIGVLRGSKRKLGPITVAMQQTLSNFGAEEYRELDRHVGIVIVDEVQRAAANTLYSVIDKLSAKYRVGVSDSEKRRDGKEFLTRDLFGDEPIEVTDEELEGTFTMRVDARVIPTGHDARWYFEKPDESFDPFGDEEPREAEETTPQDFNRLLQKLVSDQERTELAIQITAKETKAGNQMLLMTHRREHALEIDARLNAIGIRCGLMLGGKNGEESFDAAVKGLNAGKLRAAVGTIQAVGTGLDLPSVSRALLATPIQNNKQLLRQVRGRICRMHPGKKDAVLYYLDDTGSDAARKLRNWISGTTDVLTAEGWESAKTYIGDLPADPREALSRLAKVF